MKNIKIHTILISLSNSCKIIDDSKPCGCHRSCQPGIHRNQRWIMSAIAFVYVFNVYTVRHISVGFTLICTTAWRIQLLMNTAIIQESCCYHYTQLITGKPDLYQLISIGCDINEFWTIVGSIRVRVNALHRSHHRGSAVVRLSPVIALYSVHIFVFDSGTKII